MEYGKPNHNEEQNFAPNYSTDRPRFVLAQEGNVLYTDIGFEVQGQQFVNLQRE
jgi:hypothetical protein